MANYSTLKAAVADVVKTNGTQAITGANLQAVLLSIINSVGGGGYIFKGVATPSTDAGTPDENVFYIGGAGTYANFGTSVVVPLTNIAVFKYNGTWTCEQVTVENGGVFDISAFNAVGGTLATYADLATALGTNGVNIPEGVRKGGMSIKFVQSSDNKYVQYFCNAQNFTSDTNAWEKIDLEQEVNLLNNQSEFIINPDYSFEFVDGKYIAPGSSGNIHNSPLYSYTEPKEVHQGEILIMWRQGIGVSALIACDENGQIVRNIKTNTQDDTSSDYSQLYVYEIEPDVNYIMMSGMTVAFKNKPPFIVNGYIAQLQSIRKKVNLSTDIARMLCEPDYSFTYTKGKYISPGSGEIRDSATFSLSSIHIVEKGDIVVMWRQGIGAIALASVQSDGTFIRSIFNNSSNNTSDTIPSLYVYEVEADVNYVRMSGKTEAFEKHPAFIVKGYIANNYRTVSNVYKLTTAGNGDSFTNITIKKGFSYRFKVKDTDIKNKFSIFLKYTNGSTDTIFNNYTSSYNYETYYEFTAENNAELCVYNEYWGTDIDGNTASRGYLDIIIVMDYIQRPSTMPLLKDNISNNAYIDGDSMLYGTSYLNRKLDNIPMYDATTARLRDNIDFLKIFFLDCGRKFYSVTNIKLMIDACHNNNIGYMALHFSENEGFRFVLDDSTFSYKDVTYDIESVAGDNGTRGDGSNLWLTESDMDEIISYAGSLNVGIIPDFDMPGHMACILRLFFNNGQNTLPINNYDDVEKCMLIAEKYIKYFANKGCKYYNFGCDEPSVPPKSEQQIYANFMNRLCHLIISYDMIPMAFNDCICCKGNLPYMNKGINVIYWNSYLAGSRSIDELKKFGYKLVQTGYDKVWYYIMSSNYTQEEEAQFVSALSQRVVNTSIYRGVMFCLWSETPAKYGADGGNAITQIILPFITAFGQVGTSSE